MKQKSSFLTIRWYLLIIVLLFVSVLFFLHQYPSILVKTPSVCALCPFGGIETFYSWVTNGYFLHRTGASSLILLVSIIITGLLFKRSFCGQVCPLGTLQELFGSWGSVFTSVKKSKKHLKKDSFRWTKYVVFAAFVVFAWSTSSLFFRSIDPWVAFSHIWSAELFSMFTFGFIVLIVTIIGSFFMDRFFCKYLCPLGAFLSLIAPISLFKVVRNKDTCTSCCKCDQICPMNIPLTEKGTITDIDCIDCYKCVEACPTEDCISIQTKNGKKISPLMATLSTYLIIFALILFTTIAGIFRWTAGPGSRYRQNSTESHSEVVIPQPELPDR